MFKVSHTMLIFLSGLVWLGAGCFLLPLGLNFIVEALLQENVHQSQPVLHFLAPYVGSLETAVLIWISFALMIGYIKGTRVFSKNVNRSVNRILTLPNPSSLSKIYPPSYYVLLASMVLLGMLVRFAPLDVRGGIDVVVGAALIHGAILYFRRAWVVYRTP